MSDLIKVTALPTSVTVDGKKYGPFFSTAEKPFTEVPAALAALNLPLYVAGAEPIATAAAPKPTSTVKPAGSLPEGYPSRDLLIGTQFVTVDAINSATDDELLAVDGIGPATLKAIRAYKG